jgi:hypothetical protein
VDNNFDRKIVVAFRNDDPSACSNVDHEKRIADVFESFRIPQTIGVVPLFCKGNIKDSNIQTLMALDENPEMVNFLRDYIEQSGSEIALHGCTHQANRFSRHWRDEHFEFEGLPLNEQEELISRGTKILVDNFEKKPITFIPPWNRLDHNTVHACLRQGYKIISSDSYIPHVDGIISLGMNCELHSFPSKLKRALTSGNDILLVINYHSRFIIKEKEISLLKNVLEMCVNSSCVEVLTLAETVRKYKDLVQKSYEAAINVVPQWRIVGTERSRIILYQRTLNKLRLNNKLEQRYSLAHSLYWEGKYDQTISLSKEIDQLCKRMLILGRFNIFFSGVIMGIFINIVTSQFPFINKIYLYLIVMCTMFLIGEAFIWYFTSKDAKKELLFATLLFIGGITMVLGIGEIL